MNWFKNPTVNGNKVWNAGNDGSGSGLDADTLDGYHANGSNDRPYGHIPTIESNGVMEVGRYIDFHNDNDGKHDFSTRLQSTGNYGNEVNLPSASGTLALINDVNNYYWANVKISTSSSTTTSPTFSNVYLGNSLYLNARGSNSVYNGPKDSASGGLYWTGQSDYAKLYAEETAGDNLDLVIQFGGDNSDGLSIRNKANTQTSYISAGGVITTGTFKGNLDWSYITNKPASYTPSAHTHTVFKNNLMIKGTNGMSDSASIHLGIGDSDTGFKWIYDGAC